MTVRTLFLNSGSWQPFPGHIFYKDKGKQNKFNMYFLHLVFVFADNQGLSGARELVLDGHREVVSGWGALRLCESKGLGTHFFRNGD